MLMNYTCVVRKRHPIVETLAHSFLCRWRLLLLSLCTCQHYLGEEMVSLSHLNLKEIKKIYRNFTAGKTQNHMILVASVCLTCSVLADAAGNCGAQPRRLVPSFHEETHSAEETTPTRTRG